MKKILNLLFSRLLCVILALFIQAFLFVSVIWRFSNLFIYFYIVCSIISIAAVLFIINDKSNPAYKIAWIIPIMLFPIFGGIIYMIFGGDRSSRFTRTKMYKIQEDINKYLEHDEDIIDELALDGRTILNQSLYIQKTSFCPVYKNSSTRYLTPGEDMYGILIDELKSAEKFIFLEYFIIQEGLMWNTVLEILKEKVKEGVDVRIIYDDLGTILTLPYKYNKKLEQLGIKCCVFNPFIPVLSVRLNNRDHRKIAVIDGHTAFTGGINLADEYINAIVKYGYWKDSCVVVRGEAVWSFTVMFLTLWNYLRKTDDDYRRFQGEPALLEQYGSDGFVQPFTDSPLDDEPVGEAIYLNIINTAEDFVYINTPYLVPDNEMITALCLAAKRSVDVRIITPHMGDKWFVHAVTRSNYNILVENGVKIYEYTPGFNHAKSIVSDDKLAVVSTINLDYRSLYLHFECGAWLYKTKSVSEIKEDFLSTMKESEEITLNYCRSIKWYRRLGRSILRIFAPLM
jgi:Phosphatidylserine/phosphatidylglycerophosphate/cardiolipin synthases and related enzymes